MRASYLRYPHVHGDSVVFVAHNDLWTVDWRGGMAQRRTGMNLPAQYPRFSADGRQLIWTVVQGSSPEAVTAAVDGSGYRQLTWWGALGTRTRGFTPSGRPVVTGSHADADFRMTWAWALPPEGGQAQRLPYGPVSGLAWDTSSAPGSDRHPLVVCSAQNGEPAFWKRYRGGAAGKLWIDPDGEETFHRLVPELDGNISDPCWSDGRVCFLSDHEGHGNVYSVRPDGTDLRRHTDHEGFYARHLSSDGHRLVYQRSGRLYGIDGAGRRDDGSWAEAERIQVDLGVLGHHLREQPYDGTSRLASAVPDYTGSASAVENRGAVHLLLHGQGPARAIESDADVRARLPRLPGDQYCAFVSDRTGEDAVHLVPLHTAHDQADDEGEVTAHVLSSAAGEMAEVGVPRRFDLPRGSRVSLMEDSLDGRFLAVSTYLGVLILIDLESGEQHQIQDTPYGSITDLAFSTDSQWLAWAEPVGADEARSRIMMVRTTDPGAGTVEVTDGRFRDHSPSFTPDGKFLAFLSERSFDPVYDTQGFDLSFPASTKPFLVALDDDTPSPFGPWTFGTEQATGRAPGSTVPLAGQPKPVAGLPEAGPVAPQQRQSAGTVVDIEGLSQRLVPVPVVQGRYTTLTSVDGGLLWLADASIGSTGDGRSSSSAPPEGFRLEYFSFQDRSTTVLVDRLDRYRASGDRKRVVCINGSSAWCVPSNRRTSSSNADHQSLDLGRIRITRDPLAAWRQALTETWRLARDFFWTEDMAGIDWDGVLQRYLPVLEALATDDDFMDILRCLQGELGTSHAYVTPWATQEPRAGYQGRLGADLVVDDGRWRIARILPGESSDPRARSPLTAPGAAASAGEVLLEIDGQTVDAQNPPDRLLAHAGERIVELTLEARDGTRRRIAVVPIRSEGRLRYQHWVNVNRSWVHGVTQGRIGYLNIPDMVATGWAQLHRDLDAETAQEGLIVDVRRNTGGHTSQLVVELLSRTITAWYQTRGKETTAYPANAPRGPLVLLADEFAGSDGDIITQVAKLKGFATVVGTRTWGGVVGIDNLFRLSDGTKITQPRYRTWFTGGVGYQVENRGVEPDIEVVCPPHAWGAGEDPQLRRAVEVLLDRLAESPPAMPPARDGYPNLAAPPLPPRGS